MEENELAGGGARFVIPLVIPEGVESGDGRVFKKNSITIRELPLPLMWQIKTGTGHSGSVVVGRIDHMERVEGGIGNAYGVFDSGEFGQEAERMVRNGFLRGVSADMDKFEAEEATDDESKNTDENSGKIKKDKIVINSARIMGTTIVPKPAFQECAISLVDSEEELPEEENVIPDGIYVDEVDPTDAKAVLASAMIAGAIPTEPPAEWFEDPKLSRATPLTVDNHGHIYGHIAAWSSDHIGMVAGTKPPRSRSNYAYFHTGVCRTDAGTDVPVGQLTLAGGHASITADANEAVKHYDDTASAFADVHAGEDAHGIWVAGALRPGTTPEQIRAIRASAPSGDWRPIKGRLELVAVCQVNVPGFPIARAMVAGGQVMALVAAGARAIAKLRENPIDDISARLTRLEEKEHTALIASAEAVKARFDALRPEQSEQPAAIVADGIYEEVEPHLVSVLETLLADVVAYKFRAHGYHWNVKGHDFSQYHELFGEIYSDADGAIDPIAENILKLGYDSPFNISTFAEMSPLSTASITSTDCCAMAYDLYMANEYLIAQLKNAFGVADSTNEQGIANFLSERIDAHQKWSWQLKASSVPEFAHKELTEGAEYEPYETVFSAVQEMPEAEGLTASADSNRVEQVADFTALVEFASFTQEQRDALAEKGQAMKDGSYPIRNKADLKNAIRAIGRANKSKRLAVRKHIAKRAKALGAADLLPAEWALTASAEDLRARIALTAASVKPKPESVDLRARIAEFSARGDEAKKA